MLNMVGSNGFPTGVKSIKSITLTTHLHYNAVWSDKNLSDMSNQQVVWPDAVAMQLLYYSDGIPCVLGPRFEVNGL